MLTHSFQRPVRSAATGAFLLLSGLAAAAPLSAQLLDRLTVAPLLGGVNPRGELNGAPILGAPNTAVAYPDMRAMVSLGASAELAVFDRLGVRASVMRTLDGTETGQWKCQDENGVSLPCPSILILVPTDISLTTSAFDLVGHLGVGRLELSPVAGVAWMRYGYSWDPGNSSLFPLAPGHAAENLLALHLGLATAVTVDGLRVRAEYGTFRSGEKTVPAAPNRTARWLVGVEMPLGR